MHLSPPIWSFNPPQVPPGAAAKNAGLEYLQGRQAAG
jgi:hypothetical protein